MSFIVKTKLILLAVCLVGASALAQPPGRGKTAAADPDAAFKQATALFDAGQNEHQKGNYEQAVAHYTAALKLEPSLWQIGLQLSQAQLALKRLAAARETIQKVIEQLAGYAESPELKQAVARAQIVLGEIALAEGKQAEAAQAFRQALVLNPSAARARAGLAEALLLDKQFAEAVAEAKAALAAGDERTSTYALLGEALRGAGRHEEALSVLNELLKREPRFAPALRYRAEVFAMRNDLNGAMRDLREALIIEPRLADKLRLAEWHVRAKQLDEAAALYQQVLKDEPDNKEAQTALAVLLIETGKGGEAIAQLEALAQAEPQRVDVRAQLAALYLPTAPEKALEQYLAAAKLKPEKLSYQLGAGTALVKLKRFPEAAELLRRLLAQNPEGETAYVAHTNLATALFEMDDFANAAREFVWILNQQKERQRAAVTLFFLGICFDKLGDLEQAQKAYNQFLAVATPDNQLEIDKVKLRLPALQRQLEKGQGKRKK